MAVYGSKQSMRCLLRAFKLPLGQNTLLRCPWHHCKVQPVLQLVPCVQLTSMNCLFWLKIIKDKWPGRHKIGKLQEKVKKKKKGTVCNHAALWYSIAIATKRPWASQWFFRAWGGMLLILVWTFLDLTSALLGLFVRATALVAYASVYS